MRISVTTLIQGGSGYVWWPCEFDAPDGMSEEDAIAELCEMLAEDGVVHLTKLETERGPGGVRTIIGRVPIVLGVHMVGSITPLHMEIREAVG